ncbi:MAG: tetratricopeptide repeat protein [Candidatus Omnitrophota bacterium]
MKSKRFFLEVFMAFIIAIFGFYFLPKKIAVFINNQAASHYKNGNFSQAIEMYKKSIKIYSMIENRYNLACAYEEIGKTEEAIKEFEIILKADPNHRLSRDALVDIYRSKNDYEKAEYYLKKFRTYNGKTISENLKELNRNKAISVYNEGIAYFAAEDYGAAVLKMKETLDLDAEFIPAYQALGSIALHQNRLKEAVAYYKKAISLGSENSEIFNNLGIIYMLNEDYEKAIKYLKEANKLNPQDIDIQYSLASTLRDNHDFEGALSLFKKIVLINFDYPNIHNDIAECYDCIGEFDLAEVEYRKEQDFALALLSEDKYNIPAQLRLAKAYNGLKQTQKAKDMLDLIIRQKPNYREAYYARYHVLTQMGEKRLADIDLEKAKQLLPDFSKKEVLISEAAIREKTLDKNFQAAENIKGNKPNFIADTIIIFNNGHQMRGKLKQETEDKIELEILLGNSLGSVTFSKNKINSIEKI